jgi:hypothetical protein
VCVLHLFLIVLCFVVAILFPLGYALSRENVTLSVTLFFQATTIQSSGNETFGTTKRTSGALFGLILFRDANLKYDYIHDYIGK